jgi:hypothetical protein
MSTTGSAPNANCRKSDNRPRNFEPAYQGRCRNQLPRSTATASEPPFLAHVRPHAEARWNALSPTRFTSRHFQFSDAEKRSLNPDACIYRKGKTRRDGARSASILLIDLFSKKSASTFELASRIAVNGPAISLTQTGSPA